jgi:hypothetical protein
MPLPIQYPLVGGNRHSSASAELKIFNGTQQIPPGLPFAGWSKISYEWELTPVYVKGHHPDPIAMTIGEAKYTLEWDVYLAEYNLLLATLGQGFATMYLQFQVSYTENGFDTIVDTINGVRLTTGGAELTTNADPLKRTIKCMPLKILPNGVDMLAVPLTPTTA